MTRPFFSGKAVFELQTPDGALRFRIDTTKDTYTLIDMAHNKSITLSSAALAEAYRLMTHMITPTADTTPEPLTIPALPSRPIIPEDPGAAPRPAPSIFDQSATLPPKAMTPKARSFFGVQVNSNVQDFPVRHCASWSAAEDAIVKAGWVTDGQPIEAFKNRLERTDGAIYRRMVRLGIGATESELRQENSRRLAQKQTGNNA